MDEQRNVERLKSYFDVLERLVQGVTVVATTVEPATGEATRETPASTPARGARPPAEAG